MHKKFVAQLALYLARLIIMVLVAVLAMVFVVNRAYAPMYVPYLPQHVALVLDDKQQSKDVNTKLGFVLADVKAIAQKAQRFAVVHMGGVNEKTDGSAIASIAQSFYVDIFSNRNATQGTTAVFNNAMGLTIPVEIKSYLDSGNNVRLRYDRNSQVLSLVFLGQVLTINGETLRLNDYIAHTVSDISPDTVLSIGDVTIDLENYNNDYTVTVNDLLKNGLRLYHRQTGNVISDRDGSFENGLWVSEVGDCSAYLPGNPSIAIALSADASAGSHSLQLSAKNHFACTYKSFPVSLHGDERYRLSFDYRSVAGTKVQAYYNLKNNDGKTQDKFEFIDTHATNWQHYSTIITPKINDISSLDLYFYAPSDGSTEITNRYDAIRFETFIFDKQLDIRPSDFSTNYNLYNWVKLMPGNNTFQYVSDTHNLLSDNNPSFEDGMWATSPQDCSNYLPGDADISMVLSSDATQGTQSLELSARNHFACTFKTFPISIEGSKLYRFGFDYKNLTGGKVQYYYNLKNDQGQNQDAFEVINATSTDWKHFESVITPTIDKISSADIYFYAPSDGSGEVADRYDNVSLTEYLPKEIYSYYLYAQIPDRKAVQARSVEYRTVDRWTSVAVIHNVSKPFLLVYPRAYSSQWALYPYRANSAQGLHAPNEYYRFSGDTTNRAEKSEVNAFIRTGLISAVGRQYISKNNDGYIRNDNVPSAPIFTSVLNNPLDVQWHFEINDGLNAWYIDPAAICKHSSCLVNPDGTYTISVFIEHRWYRFTVVALLVGIYMVWCMFIARYYRPRS